MDKFEVMSKLCTELELTDFHINLVNKDYSEDDFEKVKTDVISALARIETEYEKIHK